ncbi:MAG: Hpt domain-containing protein [Burkholderiales bacterium]|nr:Hpt domain-containing protein [Burkholderiales bacterium]
MSDADDLAAELAALATEYRAKLAGRLDSLDACAAELPAGPARTARLADLRRELHPLAGSARTFGLPAVSAAARDAERFLDPWCDAQATPGAADWEALRALLAALRQAAGAGA